MDLLNYQYLDKMNNNIGILCYEGKRGALWAFLKVVFKTSYLLLDAVEPWASVNDGVGRSFPIDLLLPSYYL